MYFLNVVHPKQFYASTLGEKVAATLKRYLKRTWAESSNETLLAIGYPTPLLETVSDPTNTLVVCMPAGQGALGWPSDQGNKVALSREGQLPLPNNSVNRVLIIHTLEYTTEIQELMQEVWRVLTPSGRLLAIVPNRLSLWTHSGATPFDYGRPFSLQQIHNLLEHSPLTYLRAQAALFFFPSHVRWLTKLSQTLEWLGRLCLPMCGGVWIVEAEKQIYASIKQPVKYPLGIKVPLGAAQPTA